MAATSVPAVSEGRRGTAVRAAVCHGPGAPLLVEDLTLADPGPDEVRVAIEACGICHSDLTYVDGGWAVDYPVVLGHEAAGRVTEVGGKADGPVVGEKVVVSLIRSCGQCRACRRGHDVACTGRMHLHDHSPLTDPAGNPVTQGLYTGAFADAVVVHRSQCVPVPEDLPSTSAALLGCAVLTGVGAVTNTARVDAGEAVVVVGCGGVGLAAVQGARIAGADPIVAVDPLPNKRDAALRFGATHAVDADDDVTEAVRAATGGQLADHVLVTTPAPAAMAGALDLAAPMGTLILVGIPDDGVTTEFDTGLLAVRNQSILGSKMGTSRPAVDVPLLVEHWRAGRLDLDGMVTSVHPLEGIAGAVAEMRSGAAIRTVVCPGGTER